MTAAPKSLQNKSGQIDLSDLMPRFRDKVEVGDVNEATLKPITVVTDWEPYEVLKCVSQSGVKHVIQSTGINYKDELNAAALMLSEPAKFLQDPLGSVLETEVAGDQNASKHDVLSLSFCHAKDKQVILSELERVLENITPSATLRIQLQAISDELITNALYNAPHVGTGKSLEEVKREASRPAVFKLAATDDRLAVSCSDQYGSLNINQMIKKVAECYNTGVAENMNMGTGGAGIGTFIVFNTCTSLYIAVDPGVQTTVAAALPLKMSGAKRAQAPKNIHILYSKEGNQNGSV